MISQGIDWVEQGEYLDFKEKDNGTWIVGYVIAKAKTFLKVRQEGWSSKYDEMINLTSNKLQPFRTIVRGYTGQMKYAGLRDHWKYTSDNHNDRLKKLQKFMSELPQKSSRQITQFLRGENYFYLDFLMTNTYETNQDLSRVYQHFKKTIDIVRDFLKAINQTGVENWFKEVESKDNEQAKKIKCYRQCYFEFFDSIYIIVGNYPRLSSFFKNNDSLFRQNFSEYQSHQKYILAMIGQAKLEQQLTKIIIKMHELVVNRGQNFPFSFTYAIFHLFIAVEKSILLKANKSQDLTIKNAFKEQRKKLIVNLYEIIKEEISKLTSKNMKSIQTEKQIDSLFSEMKMAFFKFGMEKQSNELIEKSKLRMAVLMIQCDILQRKLKGIQRIKQFYELLQGPKEYTFMKTTPEQLTKVLNDSSIIHTLFQLNQHPEIIKKACQLMFLLYKGNIFSFKQIQFIWKTCAKKHQAVRKVIFGLWAELCFVLDRKDISFFVKVIKDEHQNEQNVHQLFHEQWQIDYLFQYTTGIMARIDFITEKIEKDNEFQSHISCLLNICYQKVLKTSNIPDPKRLIHNFSKMAANSPLSTPIIKKLYSNLQRKVGLALNIQILTQICSQAYGKQIYMPENVAKIIINCIKAEIKNEDCINLCLKFLDEINYVPGTMMGEYEMSEEEFLQLWDIFSKVQQQNIKKRFYNWMVKRVNEDLMDTPCMEINLNFTPDLKKYIFSSILCSAKKIDYINMSTDQFMMFMEFMNNYNTVEKKLDKVSLMNFKKLYKVKNPQLSGLKNLWDIFLNCKNIEVIKLLVNHIIMLHFNYSESVSKELQKAKIENLMAKIQKNIKDGNKKGNIKLMNHSLMLLQKIIELIKEKNVQQTTNKFQQHTQFKGVIKIFFQSNSYEIEIFFGETYYQIKNKIANKIKLNRTEFNMKNVKNQQIKYEFLTVPFCFMQEKVLKVSKNTKEDLINTEFIFHFIKNKIELVLIQILENETVCENAYFVLEQLSFNYEQGEKLIENMLNLMQKLQHANQNKQQITNYQLYVNLFFLKIANYLSENMSFVEKFIRFKSFPKLFENFKTKFLNNNINTFKMIVDLTELTIKIYKKYNGNENQMKNEESVTLLKSFSQSLRQNCIILIKNLCIFASDIYKEEVQIKSKSIRIFINILSLIQLTLPANHHTLDFITNHNSFKELMEVIFFKIKIIEIRRAVAEKFKRYLQTYQTNNQLTVDLEVKISEFFVQKFYYQVRLEEKNGNLLKQSIGSHQIYRLVSTILPTLSEQIFNKYIFQPNKENIIFYETLLKSINSEEDEQSYPQSTNFILNGHLLLLLTIVRRNSELINKDLIDFVLFQCLFYKEGSQRKEVRCLSKDNMNIAVEILYVFCFNMEKKQINMEFCHYIMKSVMEFQRISYWRHNGEWCTSVQDQHKSKYMGLQNPGCICYMNSLIQQLYMIEDFRKSIYNLELPQPVDKEDSESSSMEIQSSGDRSTHKNDKKVDNPIQLLQALKELFFKLQFSKEQSINPVFFSKTIKNAEGKSMIRIFEQMDIDEFCSILFDRMQQQISKLKNNNNNNFVKEMFGGTYAHQIISKECNHSSERQEQFVSISLDVRKNIKQGFSTLVKGEMLDGQNKYFCEKCDKKVKAEKMQTLKKLPQYLVIALRRFYFDFELQAKLKINDYCQFPPEMNLKQYSQQQINKVSKQSPFVDQQNREENNQLSDNHFIYKLRGVVVHTGSADSGHYYSFVEDKEKKWFQYNDQRVSEFDSSSLPEEAFGSKEPEQGKVKNAYLVFYERVKKQKPLQKIDIENSTQLVKENSKIISKIINKNKDINKFRLLFSKTYNQFVKKILLTSFGFNKDQKNLENWHKFILSYYLFISIRQQDIDETIEVSKNIEKMIENDFSFCKLFLQHFSSVSSLEQFFVFCSVRSKAKILSHLIFKALIEYQKRTDQQQMKKDTFMEDLFNSINICFYVYENIYEIELFLRKVVEYQMHSKKLKLSKIFLINLWGILLENVFGIGKNKEEKEKYMSLKVQYKYKNEEIFGKIQQEGRKYIPNQKKQTWRLLTLFLIILQETQEFFPSKSPEKIIVMISINKNIEDCEISKLSNIFHDCHNEAAIINIYQFFKYIKKESKVFECIEKALKAFESSKFRPFMILIQHIILDDTPDKSQNTSKIIELLKFGFKENAKFYIEISLIQQWILRFCQISPIFCKKISSQKEFLFGMIKWIQSRPAPNSQTVKKHKNPHNERLLNRLNGILVSSDPKQYEHKSKEMESLLGAIYQESIEFQSTFTANSTCQNIGPGSDIEFFESAQWSKGIVTQNNYSMLNITRLTDEKQFIYWSDSQKVRRPYSIEMKKGEPISIEYEDNSDEDSEDLYN